jgi:outer membrane protein assembly factor BamA
LAVTGSAGTTSRVVIPMSWGGDKRAGVEFQKEFARRLAPRVRTGVFAQRRTHPFFRSDADRTRLWARAEWQLFKPLHVGTTAAWQKATLLDRTDTTRSLGADLVLDTRLDSVLPRKAVYARASVDRLRFPSGPLTQTALEARGYIGVFGQNVLVLRALRDDSSRSAPPYFKWLLGGDANLRGFRAGTAVGDTLVSGSAELRVPLSSPITVARFGLSAFLDAGTVYNKGQRFRDQPLKKGVGGGLWATAALFQLSFVVAHGIGAGTRVHFDAGLTF